MATTNDLKNGMTLNLDGQLWTVVEFQHVKPGKGPAFVRTKMKHVLSGKVVEKTFNAGLKVEVATVDKRDMTYLYKDAESFVFMDKENFDQMYISEATVGEETNAGWRLENKVELCLVVEAPSDTGIIGRAQSNKSKGLLMLSYSCG